MKDAQKQQRMMRDKRLKAVQHGQSSGAGGHGGGGWQGQQSYSMAVACGAGPSCTRSGIPYGMRYLVCNMEGKLTINIYQSSYPILS